MGALQRLHDQGQRIWLDNITRTMLREGTLARYIDELTVTGLTSNPTIFQKAIAGSDAYDAAIKEGPGRKLTTEDLFFVLALEDIVAAADCFRPIYDATGGVDGFVSLEVSPTLANDAAGTVTQARQLFARADRPNLFIKVPGTTDGLEAIEELIFSGIPVNVTLLFSRGQYLGAAEAYLKGIERRIEAGLGAYVPSVASVFISRWDKSSAARLPAELKNRLGIAVGQRAHRAYRELLESSRWQRIAEAGGHPQRLLWASTGTKDPSLPDTYYITALAADRTVNTIPESTLLAFHDHGEVAEMLSADSAEADRVVSGANRAGVDVDRLATDLQLQGRDAFVGSWNEMLVDIRAKVESLLPA